MNRIGWENNQGAYFINKLQDEVDSVKTDATQNASNIGKMSDLTTTNKDTLVKAINEVDANANSALSRVGDVETNLTTSGILRVTKLNSANVTVDSSHSQEFNVPTGSKGLILCYHSYSGLRQSLIMNDNPSSFVVPCLLSASSFGNMSASVSSGKLTLSTNNSSLTITVSAVYSYSF